MFNTAFNLHSQGKLEEAEKIYKEILTNEPRNAQVLNLLGLVKISQNNLDEDEKLITGALSIKTRLFLITTAETELRSVLPKAPAEPWWPRQKGTAER